MGSQAGPTALEVVTELLGLRPSAPGDAPGTRVGVVAGGGGPAFLVPLGWSEAAAASCLAYQRLREPRTRLNRFVVGHAVRTGAGRRAVLRGELTVDDGEGSLLVHLREVLCRDDLAIAAGIGRIHQLWRPTLQVFAPDGTPLAYVKIGRHPLVADLLGNEAEVLAKWAAHPDPRLVVPPVIARTTWSALPVVSVAPMPDDVRRLPAGPVSAWGVRTLDEPLPDAPLDAAPWWTGRQERAAGAPEVEEVLDRVADRHGGAPRSWARWHGDWVPWNLARCRRGLVAWDWEYSEPGAPVGLDEAHQAYQVARVAHGRPVVEAFAATRQAAPSPWVADAHVAMLVTRAHDVVRATGSPLPDHRELLDAARAVLR